MLKLKNDRLLRAMRREPVDVTPVWVMRQAGRYLPEYRATRQRAGSFMTLCKTPELACEVTLQPLERFDLDAAIIFSDILTIPDAMGLGLEFFEGRGPVFAKPLQSVEAIHALEVPATEKLAYVYDAIKLTSQELAGKMPLLGFCGSPWTLAAYMVQGHSSPGFPLVQSMLEQEPKALQHLLDLLAKAVAAHLIGQIEAGAQAVMLFDTWGGLLNTENYLEYSLKFNKQIIAELKQRYQNRVPIVLFTKGSGTAWLPQMVDAGCDVIGLDWKVSLQAARKQVGDRVALQGNLDPACLRESPEMIRAAVKNVLADFGQGNGHVFNLGHGITPDIPPEHVSVLVDAVHEFSRPYHQE